MDEKQRIIEKVQKLLALGSSANESEASSAIQKAHDLLARYNLELGDVPGSGDGVVEEVWSTSKRTRIWKSALISTIAHYNFCALLTRKGTGPEGSPTIQTCLVGRPHNILAARLMAEYLFGVMERLVGSYPAPDKLARESYTQGLAMKLVERIKDLSAKDAQGASPIKALVLSEQGHIAAYLRSIGSVRTRSLKLGVNDPRAFKHGNRDASGISLNKQTTGPKSQRPALGAPDKS